MHQRVTKTNAVAPSAAAVRVVTKSRTKYSLGCNLSCSLRLLLALIMLHSLQLTIIADGLPITSKPIEGRAEQIAWQEWQRATHEQRTQGKQKKVTAKSIFTLPFRQCPPNHELYKERCIPLINISPSELLNQQIFALIGGDMGGINGDGTYDYDDSYIDTTLDDMMIFGNGQSIPMPLSAPMPLPNPLVSSAGTTMATAAASAAGGGGGGGGSVNIEEQQPPHDDAPLRFNIFQSKYPTGNGDGSDDSTDMLDMHYDETTEAAIPTATPTTTTTTAVKKVTPTGTTTTMESSSTSDTLAYAASDLQMASTNIVPSSDMPTTTVVNNATESSDSDNNNNSSNNNNYHKNNTIFGIDAIILPADLAAASGVVGLEPSLKDSSNDKNATSTNNHSDSDNDNDCDDCSDSDDCERRMMNVVRELAQLLTADAFLPAQPQQQQQQNQVYSNSQVTPVLSAHTDNDYTSSSSSGSSSSGSSSDESATEYDENLLSGTIMPIDADKDEHERSITEVLTADDVIDFEGASTMLPETEQYPQSQLEMQQQIAEDHNKDDLAEKSKVEPVAAEAAATVGPTTEAAIENFTAAAATEALASAVRVGVAAADVDDDDVGEDDVGDDRFHASNVNAVVVASGSDMNAKHIAVTSDNIVMNTIGSSSSSSSSNDSDSDNEKKDQISENHFEQQLRIINELVKSKQQQQQEHAVANAIATESSTSTAAAVAADVTEASTLWSKLMHISGLSAAAVTVPATTSATATTETELATAAVVNGTSPAIGDKQSITTTNRSNRNSKIIRIDKSVETTTTSATTTASVAATSIETSHGEFDSFWWLPTRWRLDRRVDQNGEDVSLLLRFFTDFAQATTATGKNETTTVTATATTTTATQEN